LGYWRTTKSNDVFYTLAEEGAPTRKYSIQQGKVKEKAPEQQFTDRLGYDVEGQGNNILSLNPIQDRSMVPSRYLRYRLDRNRFCAFPGVFDHHLHSPGGQVGLSSSCRR
jgi:hypothetical protein